MYFMKTKIIFTLCVTLLLASCAGQSEWRVEKGEHEILKPETQITTQRESEKQECKTLKSEMPKFPTWRLEKRINNVNKEGIYWKDYWFSVDLDDAGFSRCPIDSEKRRIVYDSEFYDCQCGDCIMSKPATYITCSSLVCEKLGEYQKRRILLKEIVTKIKEKIEKEWEIKEELQNIIKTVHTSGKLGKYDFLYLNFLIEHKIDLLEIIDQEIFFRAATLNKKVRQDFEWKQFSFLYSEVNFSKTIPVDEYEIMKIIRNNVRKLKTELNIEKANRCNVKEDCIELDNVPFSHFGCNVFINKNEKDLIEKLMWDTRDIHEVIERECKTTEEVECKQHKCVPIFD